MQTGRFISAFTGAPLDSFSLSGSRLLVRPSARPVFRSAVGPVAFFKAKVQTGGALAGAPNKKLVAGKDIKAQQFKVGESRVSLGFTKSNELLVGRFAMLGVATSVIGELLTGKGALQQLGYETGVPIQDLDFAILAIIAFNLLAALLPARGTFIPDEEELKPRPKGALQDSKISLATPGKFFGVKGFGFTKENELFVGRLAQLGFAASLIGEGVTGKGILGQLSIETGIPLFDADWLLLFSIAFTLFAAVNEGTGKFVDED